MKKNIQSINFTCSQWEARFPLTIRFGESGLMRTSKCTGIRFEGLQSSWLAPRPVVHALPPLPSLAAGRHPRRCLSRQRVAARSRPSRCLPIMWIDAVRRHSSHESEHCCCRTRLSASGVASCDILCVRGSRTACQRGDVVVNYRLWWGVALRSTSQDLQAWRCGRRRHDAATQPQGFCVHFFASATTAAMLRLSLWRRRGTVSGGGGCRSRGCAVGSGAPYGGR